MVVRSRATSITLALLTLAMLAGCQSESDDESGAAELPLPELSLGVPEGEIEMVLPEAAPPTELALRLSVGERFPLKKTVSQRLIQGSALSESLLETWMAITVEEARGEQFRLGVQYLAVAYRHSIGGNTVYYDSRARQSEIHPDALLYHGLAGNRFSFWLSAENQIVSVEGFDQFLMRCVRAIPEGQRQAALDKLAIQVGESRIANFVDDTIGLLPTGRVAPGQQWSRSRSALQPLPMELEQTCTLSRLTDDTAEIELVGRVHPSVNQSVVAASGMASGMKLHLTSGQSFGRCVIRRNSGLPVKSEVKLTVNLKVELPDGRLVDQRKDIITQIEVFQQSGSPIEVSSPRAAASTNPPAGS